MARENAGYHHTPAPMTQRDIDAWVVRLRCFLNSSRKKMRPIGKKAAIRPLQSAKAQDVEERLLENQMRCLFGKQFLCALASSTWAEVGGRICPVLRGP